MSDLAVAAPWRGHVHAAEREISHAGGLRCRVPIDYLKIIYYIMIFMNIDDDLVL